MGWEGQGDGGRGREGGGEGGVGWSPPLCEILNTPLDRSH